MPDSTVHDTTSPRGVSAADALASALIVESDAAIRSLITSILRRQSFEVEIAADFPEALAKLDEREYELIVLDLPMNDPHGMRVLEHLRARAPRLLRRVVIVTAAVHQLRHNLPADVCRVLTKPFHLDDFIAAVAGCAGDRDGAR